ncbi:hypothetical protein Tco_1538618 [Tanacetum coccineum]
MDQSSNDYPEPENNWENVYATMYQDPEENKLQRKTGDIGSFIKWFCKRTGKKKLYKADLEGPTFNLVKAFYNNSVSSPPFRFPDSKCHKLLTDKVDLVNPEGHQILRNVYEQLPLGGPPVNIWIRNIIIRKCVEDSQLSIESYQTKLNLEQPNWDASDFLFKEDYTIVNKPIAVIYRDGDDNNKMMRIDEDTLPILLSFTHCGNKTILRVLRIILVILPEHPSEIKVFHNEDGNPARANIKQALGRKHLKIEMEREIPSSSKCQFNNPNAQTRPYTCYEDMKRSHKGVQSFCKR